MKSYKKLFKKKQKRTRKNSKINKYIYNSNIIMKDTNMRVVKYNSLIMQCTILL